MTINSITILPTRIEHLPNSRRESRHGTQPCFALLKPETYILLFRIVLWFIILLRRSELAILVANDEK